MYIIPYFFDVPINPVKAFLQPLMPKHTAPKQHNDFKCGFVYEMRPTPTTVPKTGKWNSSIISGKSFSLVGQTDYRIRNWSNISSVGCFFHHKHNLKMSESAHKKMSRRYQKTDYVTVPTHMRPEKSGVVSVTWEWVTFFLGQFSTRFAQNLTDLTEHCIALLGCCRSSIILVARGYGGILQMDFVFFFICC